MASPPTLDTEYYDCDNETILSEEHNAKMWVGQGPCNKYLKPKDSKVADHDQFVDFLNSMTDS